jgi:DNA-binding NarL/FixJ family response regulator
MLARRAFPALFPMSDVTASHLRPGRASPIRCLIVEDHQMVAEALAHALVDESDISVIGIRASGGEAREFLRRESVDVVLMDYHLPDADGVQVARQVLRDHPATHVVMVTAAGDRKVLSAALSAGCSGFISKTDSLVHLPNAIRSAVSGTAALSPGLINKLIEPAGGSDDASGLTRRERDVLRLFAQGWTADDIAEQIYVSPNTLRNYVAKINQKLGTRSRYEAVATAVRLGLVTMEADGEGERPRDG